MREKFNEKRAKWLARSKRSGGSPADESPRSSSQSHSQRTGTDASDAESLSLSGSSLNQLVTLVPLAFGHINKCVKQLAKNLRGGVGG